MNLREFIFFGSVLACGCACGVLLNRQIGVRSMPIAASQQVVAGTGGPAAEPSIGERREAAERNVEESQRDQPGTDFAGEWQALQKERNPQKRLLKTDELLAKMDAKQAATYLQTLERPGLSENELTQVGAVIERWAELDPKAALEHANAVGIRPLRTALLKAAAGAWAAEQPGAAMAWVKDLPSGEFRRGVLESIVATTGQRDPGSAIQFIDSLPPYEQGQLQTVQSEIFKGWASRNPDAAAARVLTLPEGRDRESAIVAVASTWAAMNPQAALTWIDQIPNESVRSTSMLSAISLWAQADEQATAAYLLTLPAGDIRDQGICAAMREMAKRDNATALGFFNSIPMGAARDNAAHVMVQEMAVQSGPPAAASFVASLPPGKTQEDAAYSLAMQWGALDVSGAVAWASKLSGSVRDNSLRMVLDVWSQQDAQKGAQYLLSQLPGQAQELIQGIAATQSTPEQAVAWAQQIKDPQRREAVISNVVEDLSPSDPRGAAKYLTDLSGPAQATATTNVVSSWAQKNPGAAARWTASLPEGALRSQAAAQLVTPWAESDPAAAAGWLEKLPGGASRDAAVGAFARQVATRDPESAAAWASSIGDPQARGVELENVGRRWLEIDANAAQRWITQNNAMSNEAKNNLLRTR